MWELDHNEGWALKNRCFRIMVLEKTLRSPLVSKELKPANPKGNQPWIFTGRTDGDTEAPILWPPDAKSWFIGKTLILGKIEGRKSRGRQRMRRLDDIIGSMDMRLSKLWEVGQRSLECCSPWGHKELDMTWPLNNKPMASGNTKVNKLIADN